MMRPSGISVQAGGMLACIAMAAPVSTLAVEELQHQTWDDKYLEMSVLWFQEQEHLRAAEQKVAAVPVDGD